MLIALSFISVISLPEIIIPHHGRIMPHRHDREMERDLDRAEMGELDKLDFEEFEEFDRPRPRDFERRGPRGDFKIFMVLKSVFQFILVMVIGLMIQINRRFKNLEKSKIATELSYLKSQINPHFLFNTLNSIYSLAIVGSNNTADAVVKLSNMMRYVLNDANKDWVSLEQEISYISNYIELQKLRFANSVKIDFNVSGDLSGKVIAPLIIIPFIENSFKYGVNAEQNSSIIIDINSKSKMLEVRIWNKKVDFNESDSESTGIGIENTKNRLRLLYPNRHVLSIDDNSDFFEVILIFHFI